MDRNRIEGKGREIKGEVKDTIGKVTGSTQQQVEGKLDKGMGKAQNAYGRAKDAVKDELDRHDRHGDNANLRDPKPSDDL